jgi:catechol 2,3-dioxygenase-like lactoylglutathione lyase family enzyme
MTVDWDWSRVVFDHVKIGVRDAEASRTFYRTVLATLDIPPIWEAEHGGQHANLVVSTNAAPVGPIHIGFVARSRDEADAFHRAGVETGYEDSGAPGVREQYSSAEAVATTRLSSSIPTATTSRPSCASSDPYRFRPPSGQSTQFRYACVAHA